MGRDVWSQRHSGEGCVQPAAVGMEGGSLQEWSTLAGGAGADVAARLVGAAPPRPSTRRCHTTPCQPPLEMLPHKPLGTSRYSPHPTPHPTLLQAYRSAYEDEIRKERANFSDDQLCATPFGVDVVGITEFVALTGALVGGTLVWGGGSCVLCLRGVLVGITELMVLPGTLVIGACTLLCGVWGV